MEIPILKDITVIFAFSAASLIICGRLKVPEILGYLVAGILIGPKGLGLISAVHEVEVMAEIGVVLLLFTVGLEFSLAHLISLKRPALLGGGIQVALSVLAVFGCVVFFTDLPLGTSIAIGLIASISSTAIVLKVFSANGDMDTPQGRISTAILIFQDIAVIPMLLAIPLLAGQGGNPVKELGIMSLKAVLIVGAVFIAARTIVPKIMFHAASSRNRELFLIIISLIGASVAMMTSQAGLSLALGAFLAGIVISESGYSQQALSDIVPFKDVFTGFFFVSIGMLIDIRIFEQYPVLILSSALLILFGKIVISGFAVSIIGYPFKTAFITGAALSQVGEFSFIMTKAANSVELIPQNVYDIIIAVIVLTMAISPFLMMVSENVSQKLSDIIPMPGRIRFGYQRDNSHITVDELKDHIILIGLGVAGRGIMDAAKTSDIPYIIVEINPSTVKHERENGEPIIYGDASSLEVLHHASLDSARTIVITVPDPAAVRRIVETARRANPSVHIIARTRYITENDILSSLGANEVIVEEYETALELFSRVMKKYMISEEMAKNFSNQARDGGYKLLRGASPAKSCAENLKVLGSAVETIIVPIGSTYADKTLREIDLRFRTGLTLLAVKRGTTSIPNPGADTVIMENDELILLGSSKDINSFAKSVKKS